MGKCHLCGKEALEVAEACQECLERAMVDPKQIKRLRQISDILKISANTDTNIKSCMESLIEVAEELERTGSNGKKEKKRQGAAVQEKQ